MPSANWTVNSTTYASVVSGAKNYMVQNPHPSMLLEYYVHTSDLGAAWVGFKLLPGEVRRVEVATGNNLYMRLSGPEIVRHGSVIVPAMEVA